jgi:uncharacterized protein (UPF0335 family)
MPSTQLADYFAMRSRDVAVENAAEQSGIGLKEAELWEQSLAEGDEQALALARAGARAREDEPKREGIVANGNIAADELRLLIERVERIEEERKGLADDIADVFAEAKSRGFDKAAMKKCIKLRKLEPHVRQEAETILTIYMDALGLMPTEASVALAA